MSEDVTKTQNLNSYYTTSAKVEKNKRVVVNGPDYIQDRHVFDAKDANKKWNDLNKDIFEGVEKEKKKSDGRVIDYILAVAAVVLGVIGIKSIIKFFRKS